MQGADAEDLQLPVVDPLDGGSKELGVYTAVDDHELLANDFAALLDHEVSVIPRDRDDECGLADLLAQHVAVDMEVRAVRRKAVRDPREPADDEPRGGWMIREVAVHVVDSLGLHQPGVMRDLGKDPECTEEEVETSPRAGEQVAKGPQIATRRVAEKMQLAAQHRQGKKGLKARPGGELERLGMDDVCPLTDERKQLDVDALVFDREDLVEDEGLAQAREAGHDVRDLQSSAAYARLERLRRNETRPRRRVRLRSRALPSRSAWRSHSRGGDRPRQLVTNS